MQLKPILTAGFALVGLIAALAAPAASAQGGPSAAQAAQADEAIVQMQQAARRGDRARLAALLPRTRGHILEPWAHYWDIKARLGDASPDDVQAVLKRLGGTYQEDRLRNDWLLLLGQRRDWSTFAAELPRFRMNDDREVRCYALLVQHLQTPGGLQAAGVDEVRRQWLGQREADDGCATAADRLMDDKKMDASVAWRKARQGAEANRVRVVRLAVNSIAPQWSAMAAEAVDSPVKWLAARAANPQAAPSAVATLALVRLGASDDEQATQLMQSRWQAVLSPDERAWVWGSIGKRRMLQLQDDASDAFARVPRLPDLNDELLAFAARAGLRSNRWADVTAAVVAMSEEGRTDPTWVYWRARATLQTARTEAEKTDARRTLQELASVRGFYEMLALEETGGRISFPPAPEPLTVAERDAARANAGLQRALAAIALGLRADGVREWNYTTNLHTPGGMSDRELLAAADLACSREVWDRCINTSDRTRAVLHAGQRFPVPFKDAVVKRSREIGLEPAFVYGLIRQESRFIMDARSHVGASGLMQLMPATARWTAKRIGIDNFTPDQVNDRDINIALGTGYLKMLLDDFGGSMPMAAAAYNAGPGRPRAWRGSSATWDAAQWAETIPFNETRDYVKKVLANTALYAAVLAAPQPAPLSANRASETAPAPPAVAVTGGPPPGGPVALTGGTPPTALSAAAPAFSATAASAPAAVLALPTLRDRLGQVGPRDPRAASPNRELP